jgi:tRNA dimethylallyltransferase
VVEGGSVRCLCITGPTATGKTDLVLELAERLPLEVVSMDSAMVYRGLDIGTAKPSPATREAVPHHLIDILEPTEAYSAGLFAQHAALAIEQIHERGRLPVLVGGTLLYLRALRDGLSALPRADAELRAALDREGAERGWAALHERLGSVDPAAAARIAPSDRQRIQRALEVFALTGRPISELQQEGRHARQRGVLTLALVPQDRAALAARIERRFDAMVERGLVAEVEALQARGDLTAELPSMRAVGYRQIWAYLRGDYGWEAARSKAIVATRQYAKRQLTWLRGDASCEVWPAFASGLVERSIDRLSKENLIAKNGRGLC